MKLPEELHELESAELIEEMFCGYLESPLCDGGKLPEIYALKNSIIKLIQNLNKKEYDTQRIIERDVSAN